MQVFGVVLVVPADVTRIAGHRCVRARQLEVGLVVIEAPPVQLMELWHSPQDCVNCPRCTSSLLWQPVQVAGALRQGSPGLWQAAQARRRVRALEREVGEAMIELRAAQLHDVGVAALVLGVAGAAFAGARIGHAAVIAVLARARRRRSPCGSRGTATLWVRTFVRSWQFGTVSSCFTCGTRHLARHQQRLHGSAAERSTGCQSSDNAIIHATPIARQVPVLS